MKKITLLAAAALFTSACATSTPEPSYSEADAMNAITAAVHETKRASKKDYEWNNTGKIIKKAKDAMKKKEYSKAVKLANKAKRQSTMALQQYEDQKNAGPRDN